LKEVPEPVAEEAGREDEREEEALFPRFQKTSQGGDR